MPTLFARTISDTSEMIDNGASALYERLKDGKQVGSDNIIFSETIFITDGASFFEEDGTGKHYLLHFLLFLNGR